MKLYKYIKVSAVLLTLWATMQACEDDSLPAEALAPRTTFTMSAKSVTEGDEVTFSDNSTNRPTAWAWDLPGASPNTSNEPNPTVIYETPGVYDVALVTSNTYGSDTVSLKDVITVIAKPKTDIDGVVAQVRLNFENDLVNEGLVDIDPTISPEPVATGSPSYGTRPEGGGSYIFDGTNSLEINGYTGINGKDQRSVALWVKTTSTSTTGLVNWGKNAKGSRFSLKAQAAGQARVEWQGGGITGVTTINDGNWHHVACTYDGTDVIIYVDGVEDIKIDATDAINTGSAGEVNVAIGSQEDRGFFVGEMDNVRIFDKTLSIGEIGILKNK